MRHSNCSDVCLSQKVRDVMGLHLEYCRVINVLVRKMEAIKAEVAPFCPYFSVGLLFTLVGHNIIVITLVDRALGF